MAFNKLQTADELIHFLKKHAMEDHPFFYHFTTAESLKCICENLKWRLNSARRMNDLHECTLKTNFSPLWDIIYSTCFSFGDPDNIAMWAMYGIPWEDAIRIRFSIEDMREWIAFLSDTHEPIQCKLPSGDQVILNDDDTIMLHDICYAQGFFGSQRVLTDCPRHLSGCPEECDECPVKNLLWWDQKNKKTKLIENDNNPPTLKDELVGFVKNSAWAHEHETRLTLKKSDTPVDFVDVPISKDILLKIQISIGPKSTLKVEDVKRMMAKYLLSSEDKHGNIKNVSYSYYNENYSGRRRPLLQIRRHCDKHLKIPGCFKNSLE